MATQSIAEFPALPAGQVASTDLLPIVDVSDLSSPTGTTKKVLWSSLYQATNQHNGLFNVQDPAYGAIGNGIADDTAALQAAITAAVAAGGVAYAPAGTYRCTDTLVLPDYAVLCGDGRQSQGTIFSFDATVAVGINANSQVVCSGFRIAGNNGPGAYGLQIGTLTLGSTQGHIHDLTIIGFDGAGGRGLSFSGETHLFEMVDIVGCETDLYLTGGNRPTNTLFLNCQFRGSTKYALYLDTANQCTFWKCLFESNQQYAVYGFANPVPGDGVIRQPHFYDCWFENNWASLDGDPARMTMYELRMIGGANPNQILWPVVRDCKFDNGNNRPLSMWWTNTIGAVLDNNTLNNVTATIKFDGADSRFSRVINWDTYVNGDASTVISDALNVVECDCRRTPWTTTPTGLTVAPGTGGVTYRSTSTKIGRLVHWSIVIVCTGTATTTSVSGTSYFSLPYPVSEYNSFISSNADTAAGMGVGHVSTTARAYTPSWTTIGGTVVLSGWYMATT